MVRGRAFFRILAIDGADGWTVRSLALRGDEIQQLGARSHAEVEHCAHVAVDASAPMLDVRTASAGGRGYEHPAKQDPELSQRVVLRLHDFILLPQFAGPLRIGDREGAGQIRAIARLPPRLGYALPVHTGTPAQMQVDADARAYDALARHPHAADLAAIARSQMAGALQVRRVDRRPEHVTKLAAEMNLAREDAATPFGNALDVLQRGPEDDAGRALACALAAHVVATYPPKDRDEEDRLASDLLWLGTHTHFDATGLIDLALGEAAAGLWDAIADRVRRIDQGTLPTLGKGEALVGGVALSSSRAPAAAKQAAALAADVRDRKLARVLATRPQRGEPMEPIMGEMAPAPRGPMGTAFLGVTGLLLVMYAARLFGKVALAYKKPAQVELLAHGADGVRVRWRVELLGRTLRDHDVIVRRAALVRATREVRYPRFTMYAGLLSLAAGSYVGISTCADGVRVASPSLIAWGIAIVGLGVGLDLMFSSIWPGARGRCRLLFVPRDGAKLCIAGVDTERADALLRCLAQS